MIGSRLLFSGYGAGGPYRISQSAGLVGHDSLIVHDEAHLSPAFGALVRHIAAVQEVEDGERALRVMELSATQQGGRSRQQFRLKPEEEQEALPRRRICAAKALHLHEGRPAEELPRLVTEAALAHRDRVARVLI
jgi:CRISPR-associated endonuclease/helicase Cas3